MIPLIINTLMIREIDERKLINAYAKLVYEDSNSITNDTIIKQNLEKILDWDSCGDQGLGIYCSKYENIKRKDWEKLISFIKENSYEIKTIAPLKAKKLDFQKKILTAKEKRELHNKERLLSEDYQFTGRGKKAKSCIYNGKFYKSRQECIYKEGITRYKLYKYLEQTNQL